MDLREKVVRILSERDYRDIAPEELADAILAIEDIRVALAINELVKRGAIVDAGTKV